MVPRSLVGLCLAIWESETRNDQGQNIKISGALRSLAFCSFLLFLCHPYSILLRKELDNREAKPATNSTMSVFDSPIFDPRHELKVHTLQLAIAIVLVALSIVRMTSPVPFTRGQIMGLSLVSFPVFLPRPPFARLFFANQAIV